MVYSAVMTSGHFSGWECGYFCAMIGAMAIIPLVCGAWWRRWYPLVTLAIALPAGVDIGIKQPGALSVVAGEYASFIILLGALYTISGGIVLETPARGRPVSNMLFLLIGVVLANFLGTTGASVVLIRPLIRANAWRRHVVHIYVFFIFLVSNIGGLLTPLGDPPLFLGFLRGVPFFWTLKLFPLWALAVGSLLVLFGVVDAWQVRREAGMASAGRRMELHGARNVVLLAVVIASCFLPNGIREGVMGLAAVGSVFITPARLRVRNDFTYHPIIEVAVLFAGIFVTMVPVESFLHTPGALPGGSLPCHYFWMAGGFSSVLDNAPAYLVFSSLAQGGGGVGPLVAGIPEALLVAISAGCVMMGANTYIGNGPNLMVKAICEDEGIRLPSFLGYLIWSGVVLVPLYVAVTVVWF